MYNVSETLVSEDGEEYCVDLTEEGLTCTL